MAGKSKAERPKTGAETKAGVETVSIGLRVEDEEIVFFGIDEVNRKLRKGMRVVKVEAGQALVDGAEDEDGETYYTLAGGDIAVHLAPAETVEG